MKNRLKFGISEGISLLLVALCTQVFLSFPRIMLEDAGTAGWMLVVYISVITYILLAIIIKLYSPFQGMDLIDIAEGLGGSIVKIFVGLIISVHFMFVLSVVLREFTEDLKIIALHKSPISYVTVFFVVGMLVGAYAGIVPIARLCTLSVPVITIGYLIIIIGMFPYYDLTRVLPLFGTGIKNIFINGLQRISNYSGLVALFLVTPFLKTREILNKTAYIGTAIAAAILIISTFVFSIVVPYPISITEFLPIYHLARIFYFGLFFQRIESIFIFIWVMAALLYLSAGLFLLAHVFRKTFNLKYYRPLLFPFAIIIFTLSLLPENLLATVMLESEYIRRFAWIVSFTMVILLLAIARLKLKAATAGKANRTRKPKK